MNRFNARIIANIEDKKYNDNFALLFHNYKDSEVY